MVQRSYRIAGLILSILFLSGCSSTLHVFVVAEEHPGYLLVHEDNGVGYKYHTDTGEFEPAYTMTVDALRMIEQYPLRHNLVHDTLNKYKGSYADAMSYCNILLSNHFSITKVDLTTSTLDIVLVRDSEKIRVLYLDSDIVRIFYKDILNKNQFPPYINGKEVKDANSSS